MRIILAGYNIDSSVIEELKKNSPPRYDVTPETLSAAYARISRNPKPADVLRRVARAEIEKARTSNRNIIFKMGHHSVAEHAVFNFDLIGISRLAIEALEHFRLCSFTEKSQRYITLGNDFVVPEEIKQAKLKTLFIKTIKSQNEFYHQLYLRLKSYFLDKYSEQAKIPGNLFVIDGLAKEDARYIVSLATEGQLGLTVNARNLELIIRRLAAEKLQELRDIGIQLYEQVKRIAPSIILFTEPTPYDARAYQEIKAAAEKFLAKKSPAHKKTKIREKSVSLVWTTPDADLRVISALLYRVSRLPYKNCFDLMRIMTPAQQKRFILEAFELMEFYDPALREFEQADLVYELLVSASCFAQLKRHRLTSIITQPYDTRLGLVIPESIIDIGAEKEFREIIGQTEKAYAILEKKVGQAATYILTNAHRRRVLFKVNLRELYHISRLREDASAQWEIKAITAAMTRLARKAMPYSGLLLGGKDRYSEIYSKVFGRRPSAKPPARNI